MVENENTDNATQRFGADVENQYPDTHNVTLGHTHW